MASSPPAPSFLVPSAGLEHAGEYFDAESADEIVQGGNETAETVRQERGISMYVRLLDGELPLILTFGKPLIKEEMINTVLESESYLFSPRELWVLKYILDLPYEPHYLLTRLLLRVPGKIHTFPSLSASYEQEIGEDGVKQGMKTLCQELKVPQDIVRDEPIWEDPGPNSRPSSTPLKRAMSSSSSLKTPASQRPSLDKRPSSTKPWSDVSSGLTLEEEKADPQLAEALKESLWAAKVGRVEVVSDDEEISVEPQGGSTGKASRNASAKPSPSQTPTPATGPHISPFSLQPLPSPPFTHFALSESDLSLSDLLSCMPLDELRKACREKKIPSHQTGSRDGCIAALEGLAKKQTILGFVPLDNAKGKEKQTTLPFGKSKETPKKSTKQTALPFGKPQTTETLLRNQLLHILGSSLIRLTPELHALISRVNLIFSRTPPIAPGGASLMLPSILVNSKKRRYPDYGTPARSKIWNTREELLVWERAVGWEATVTDALGEGWDQQRKNPNASLAGSVSFNQGQWLGRKEGAAIVKRIWEGVWDVWKGMVAAEESGPGDEVGREKNLVGDRFQTAHVLTRIVYKGAEALGVLHEYDTECMILKALIAQRRWRRGKRGAWYDRLALVLMNHYNTTPKEKEAKLREATQVCIDALLDEDTHIIYRPALSRRLTRLENKLNLPADERHISYASLLKCETRDLNAVRLPENRGQVRIPRTYSGGVKSENGESSGETRLVGKSLWMGKDGEVGVEEWVLEWWEKKGYKGYHSESSILTTLFTLLLWPVLFHPLPGAFETSYQTAPLDLGEDTFLPSRSALLEARLALIASSSKKAVELLLEADDRERERATWAVGVNWEYGKEDLVEILQCLGGRGVSGVCRMLAEEYRHRASGVPDLIVWNAETKDARFVEVKGPGDSLSETQKIWIDVLLSLGIQVEVCRVKAIAATDAQLEKVEKKRKAALAFENANVAGGKRSRLSRAYWKADEGEWEEGGHGAEVDGDEEDEGWEARDEMRFEDGVERRQGKLR
ncbi:hypothetical protein B9479_007136 [Cryptococcus floricola]|uniref:Fanconi-associated nuclease n=1 Tax=Cryptococcus floricola TaxID=2591691 RepID=A0A5D3AN82_9TREE|nr:hypothetical protein B9479_007136 [Cryptococcus floricola]